MEERDRPTRETSDHEFASDDHKLSTRLQARIE